jgi:hypothetical protein
MGYLKGNREKFFQDNLPRPCDLRLSTTWSGAGITGEKQKRGRRRKSIYHSANTH